MKWNLEQQNWTNFRYDSKELEELELGFIKFMNKLGNYLLSKHCCLCFSI